MMIVRKISTATPTTEAVMMVAVVFQVCVPVFQRNKMHLYFSSQWFVLIVD